MSGKLQVTVFFQKGDGVFICAVNGQCTIDGLQEIENDINDCHEDMVESGNYTFACDWFPGQYDELGRCELAPGWELDQIKFEPIKD
jgi:hypothetical protein